MNHSDIITRWPSQYALADDVGVLRAVVANWKRRNSIPARYWPLILESAERRGIQLHVQDFLKEVPRESKG